MEKSTDTVVVLDTSVILFDANSLYGFHGYDIMIPLIVLDEIDKFRSLDNEVGRNARTFVRNLKKLSGNVSLAQGVARLDTGERLYVAMLEHSELISSSVHLSGTKNDDIILAVCLEWKTKGFDIKLSTKDISLSVKANVFGIDNIEYTDATTISNVSQIYTGMTEIQAPDDLIDPLFSKGYIDVSLFDLKDVVLFENMGVIIKSLYSTKSAFTIYRNGYFYIVSDKNKKMGNVVPKNKEQELAVDLLLNPDIKLLTLTGQAGTGKTLLAVACGIQMAINDSVYDHVVISRPIQPLGNDLGYIPGTIAEKLEPWIGPIRDAVEVILGSSKRFDDLISFGKIDIEPLTYIRGRSIPRTFFILDESQNITQHEMKAIVSRMGHGSKIVLTGDIFQIDNYYLDTVNNGLTAVIERFKKSDITGHVMLTKGQRSKLATMAAEML